LVAFYEVFGCLELLDLCVLFSGNLGLDFDFLFWLVVLLKINKKFGFVKLFRDFVGF